MSHGGFNSTTLEFDPLQLGLRSVLNVLAIRKDGGLDDDEVAAIFVCDGLADVFGGREKDQGFGSGPFVKVCGRARRK